MKNGIKDTVVLLMACMLIVASCVSCQGIQNVRKNAVIDDSTFTAQMIVKSTVQVQMDFKIDVREPQKLGLVDVPFIEDSAVGSGSVVSKKKVFGGKVNTLVLTANHVCEEEFVEVGDFKLPVVDQKLSVMSLGGERFEAYTYIQDDENDLCLLEVLGDVGETAVVMDGLPEPQSWIQYAGAPAAIWPKNTQAMVLDGRFVGKDSETGFILFTCPTVGGASGSGLYFNAKLFGVVTRVNRRFHHAAYGTDNLYVVRILRTAAAEGWKINFQN